MKRVHLGGAFALSTVLAGCTVLLGFDKEVGSADDAPPTTRDPRDATPYDPPDAIGGGRDGGDDDFDATYPDEEDAGPVVVEPYLDPAFGGAGTGRFRVPDRGATSRCAVAVSANQGVWISCSGLARLYRIRPDGTRDMTVADDADTNFEHHALFAHGSGLLAAGQTSTSKVGFVARYTEGGTIDPNFGPKGGYLTMTTPEPQRYSLLSGGVFEGNTLRLWGRKYAPGGTFYNTFVVDLDLSTNTLASTIATSDGISPGTTSDDPYLVPVGMKIIDATTQELFGLYGPGASTTTKSYGFIRLKNGGPDTTFGTGGLVTHVYDDKHRTARAGAVVGDKLIIASSYFDNGSAVVARFTLAGAPDTTFGAGGFLVLSPPAAAVGMTNVVVKSILPLPNGKLLVGGTALNATKNRFFLARFTATGALDTSFGDNGYALPTIQPSPTKEEVLALALQSDGHVIVVGNAQNQSGQFDLVALRLNP